MSATFNLEGGQLPWTTTPEVRLGPGPPHTDPSLQVNLFFRVFLGIISIFISIVPARLLWWNGEFAAVVFCLNTVVSNFFYVVNALIWHDNNVETWSTGYGWCDLQVYIVFALQTSYNICLFENMRGLASKVSVQRIGALTAAEKRRQHIHSALIIFTLPLLQIILTYFIIMRRYNVSTLAGCTAVYHPNWIFLLFFVLPSPLFILGAGGMAVIAFKRVREIQKMTSSIMNFRDDAHIARQQRVRRKLYFLSFSVLIVVLPIVAFFFIANLLEGMPWTEPYDFKAIHFGPYPNNIHSVTFTTSDKMSFGDLTFNYIVLLSAIAVFITFGTTPDAYNEYRKCLVFMGLGKILPKLYEEYKPTPPSTPKASWWSSFTDSFMSRDRSKEGGGSRKGSLVPTTEHVSQPGSSTQQHGTSQSSNDLLHKPAPAAHNPWPDLSLEEITQHRHQSSRPPQRPFFRNPFKPFQVSLPSRSSTSSSSPLFSFPLYKKDQASGETKAQGKQPEMRAAAPAITGFPRLPLPHLSILSAVHYPINTNTLASLEQKEEMKRYRPLQRFTAAITADSAPTPAAELPRIPRRTEPRVETRVWSEVDSTSSSSKSSTEMPWTSTTTRIAPTSPSSGQEGHSMVAGECSVCKRLMMALAGQGQANGEGQQQGGVVVETSIAHHSMRGGYDYDYDMA